MLERHDSRDWTIVLENFDVLTRFLASQYLGGSIPQIASGNSAHAISVASGRSN
jgi:hypothetical protein